MFTRVDVSTSDYPEEDTLFIIPRESLTEVVAHHAGLNSAVLHRVTREESPNLKGDQIGSSPAYSATIVYVKQSVKERESDR